MLLSCREDIINPDTFVETINEPLQITEVNSYTYILNANEFTSTSVFNTTFNGSSSRVNITLLDYSQGYANMIIKDVDQRERYRYQMAENIPLYSDLTNGYIPKTIEINTYDFTGKLKIRLTKSSN